MSGGKAGTAKVEVVAAHHGVAVKLGGVVVVVAGIAVLWGVLFSTFGTDSGTGTRASVLVDHFRHDHRDGLGTPDRGPAWATPAGRWSVAAGAATAAPGPSGSPSGGGVAAAATAVLGRGPVVEAATVRRLAGGWGLAVRWHDRDDFAYVAARPAQGRWEVGIVADGHRTVLGTAGPAPAEGQRIELRVDDDRLELWVDAHFAAAFRGSMPDGRAVALLVLPRPGQSTGAASFGDVVAGPPATAVVTIGASGAVHGTDPGQVGP